MRDTEVAGRIPRIKRALATRSPQPEHRLPDTEDPLSNASGRTPPMLRIEGPPTTLCDGISRRQLLEVGSISALGLSLPALLAARQAAGSGFRVPGSEFGGLRNSESGTRGRPLGGELSCIMLWLWEI